MFESKRYQTYDPTEYLYHGTSSIRLLEICRLGYLERPEVTPNRYRASLWGEWDCALICGQPICFRLRASDHLLTATESDWEWAAYIYYLGAREQASLREGANAFTALSENREVTGSISLRLLGTARAAGNVPVETVELWGGVPGSELWGDGWVPLTSKYYDARGLVWASSAPDAEVRDTTNNKGA